MKAIRDKYRDKSSDQIIAADVLEYAKEKLLQELGIKE